MYEKKQARDFKSSLFLHAVLTASQEQGSKFLIKLILFIFFLALQTYLIKSNFMKTSLPIVNSGEIIRINLWV